MMTKTKVMTAGVLVGIAGLVVSAGAACPPDECCKGKNGEWQVQSAPGDQSPFQVFHASVPKRMV